MILTKEQLGTMRVACQGRYYSAPIANLLDTMADLERQQDTAQEQFRKDCEGFHNTSDPAHRCRTCGTHSIEEQKRLVDTAHAAAIQTAADFIEARYQSGICVNDILDLRRMTPADAQRLYDLRIAEAVRDEAKWWWDYTFGQSQSGKLGVERLQESRERLASANAEVERLKGLTANV